ncbi:MAG: alanine racemase [Cyanobacteriota bacterium]|nr:alanine racemase [Cyanobacteriota bacterium]
MRSFDSATPSLKTSTNRSSRIASPVRQRAWVEIDRAALRFNVRQLKQLLSPNTQLMAVVKADAYGHGALLVAETVLEAGAGALAVATLQEGIQLRAAGIGAPILVLGASNTGEEVEECARFHLQPTLCNLQQARLFSNTLTRLRSTLPVHLNIDTGMSRLGTPWQETTAFVNGVRQMPQLQLAGLYSHFATADDRDRATMQLQHQRFKSVLAQLQGENLPLPALHIANSAATLCDRAAHYDWVRIGLALYGLYPAPHLRPTVDLKPALQVKARVTQVKTLSPGTGVSYGHRYIAEREMTVAIVAIGYADGVPRNLSNRLEVLIRGRKIPQIGAITMDQLMLDASHLPDVQPGEIVTLLGRDGSLEISADTWAETLGTISWEILCGFQHRLPRISIDR